MTFSKWSWLVFIPIFSFAVLVVAPTPIQVAHAQATAQPTPLVKETSVPTQTLGLNRTQYSENFVIGDARPDAPDLAKRGAFGVGVRTMRVVNPNQLDILKYSVGNDPRYDRPLTLEVWYPAIIPAGATQIAWYNDVLGRGANDPARPNTPFEFAGRALRDAAPDVKSAPYPLVILSHGYPGSRVLMTYLTENLASKGYVVVAIDHTDSTHGDAANFASTMLNRPLDDLFVLNEIARQSKESSSWLSGLADANQTALIGYSMGGYGALNVAGAGVTQSAVDTLVPGRKLAIRQTGNPDYLASMDARIKAIVLFAPWGATVFDADGLKGIKVPSLFIAGTVDTVAGFANIKRFYEQVINSDRYFLVYENGSHNIAVNPAPAIAMTNVTDYQHYLEPAWDTARVNNINQHFVTAFLGMHLKKMDYKTYLDVPTLANENKWIGFPVAPAVGLQMYHQAAK